MPIRPGNDHYIGVLKNASRIELSRTFHIAFDSHYVTVTSSVTQVSRQLISSVEPMLTPVPQGTQAGSFDVAASDQDVVIRGSDSSFCEHFLDSEAATRALYHRAVKLLIDARQDLLWMHAGVVACAGQAVIVTGRSGHGKSTMVAEFLARGWTYLSDEIAPIDSLRASVLPFPLSPYRRISAKGCLLEDEVRQLNKVRIELAQDAISRVAVTIESIYFLSYSPGHSVTRLVHCSPGAAVVELLRNSLSPLEARDEEIRRLCGLVSRVRSTYLYYSDADQAARQVILSRPHALRRVSV